MISWFDRKFYIKELDFDGPVCVAAISYIGPIATMGSFFKDEVSCGVKEKNQ